MRSIYSIVLTAASMVLPALSMDLHASEMDGRIELSIKESYVFRNYLQGDDIKIEARDGAVTLTGIVAEYFHRSLAEVTVADVSGVKSVDNRLEIKGALPTANSDAWLRDKVKATLLFHKSVNAAVAEVDVKDGVVTLRGAAASETQKKLAAEYAWDAEGVKDVKNEMIVGVVPEKAPRTTNEKIDDVSVTALVKMALLLHRSTSATYTTVTTKFGVVTVGGMARSTDERSLVTRIVKDVNGVKKVKNRMTIK